MTAAAAGTGRPGAHRAADPGHRDGPDFRVSREVLPELTRDPTGGPGVTRIAGTVVERVAQQSVDGVDRAAGAARQVLGVRVGSLGEDTPARVQAVVDGDLVRVRVSMAVRWPESVRRVTRQARAVIVDDLTRFTGLRVAEVDITVAELLRVPPRPVGVR